MKGNTLEIEVLKSNFLFWALPSKKFDFKTSISNVFPWSACALCAIKQVGKRAELWISYDAIQLSKIQHFNSVQIVFPRDDKWKLVIFRFFRDHI